MVTDGRAETLELLGEAAADLFEGVCSVEEVDAAREAGWSATLWEALRDAGFTTLDLSDEPSVDGLSAGTRPEGGLSGDGLTVDTVREAAVLIRAAGRFDAPVPLAEFLLVGAPMIRAAGWKTDGGPVVLAASAEATARSEGSGWWLRGRAERVPYARFAERVLVPVRAGGTLLLASVDPAHCALRPGTNLAGEPRDTVLFDAEVPANDVLDAAAVPALLAEAELRAGLGRTLLLVGAAERALALTAEYIAGRVQSGRPLNRFQAVQQRIARMAEEVVASAVAAEAAVAAVAERGFTDAAGAVAAAAWQSRQSAGEVCDIAHHLHGAVGVTWEHPLRQVTTRLWSWRDEDGTETDWAARVARDLPAAPPAGPSSSGLWSWVSTT